MKKTKLLKQLQEQLRKGELKDPSIISKVEMASEAYLDKILAKTKDDLRQKIEDHVKARFGMDLKDPQDAADHKGISDEYHDVAKQMPEHKTHDFHDLTSVYHDEHLDPDQISDLVEWGHQHGAAGHKLGSHVGDDATYHIAWKPRSGAAPNPAYKAPAAKPTIPASNGQCTCPLNELMQSGCKCGAMKKSAQCTCPFNELMRNGCKCGAMQADRNEKKGIKTQAPAKDTNEPKGQVDQMVAAVNAAHSKDHLGAFRHHVDHAEHFLDNSAMHGNTPAGNKHAITARSHDQMAKRHWAKINGKPAHFNASGEFVNLQAQDDFLKDYDKHIQSGMMQGRGAFDFEGHPADQNL